MKKTLFLISCVLCFVPKIKSQNLVPNYSFESVSQCPTSLSQIYFAPPWFQPCTYYGNTTNTSSSDLYNTCGGGDAGVPYNNGLSSYQVPHTGLGYAGIIVVEPTPSINYREYLEVPLLDTLITNHSYCVTFYVSLLDVCGGIISNMGAYFSVDSLLDDTLWHAIDYIIPQVENPLSNMLNDTANWMLVSGNFIAMGGEKFMTIGNFHSPANTNYQSVSSILASVYYIDDVSVVDCTVDGVNELSNSNSFKLYPNPNNGSMTFEYHLVDTDVASVSVYDITGRLITSFPINAKNTMLNINENELTAGIYYYKIRVNGKLYKTDKIVIIK